MLVVSTFQTIYSEAEQSILFEAVRPNRIFSEPTLPIIHSLFQENLKAQGDFENLLKSRKIQRKHTPVIDLKCTWCHTSRAPSPKGKKAAVHWPNLCAARTNLCILIILPLFTLKMAAGWHQCIKSITTTKHAKRILQLVHFIFHIFHKQILFFLFLKAEAELSLARNMKEWNSADPLKEEAPTGQWKWPWVLPTIDHMTCDIICWLSESPLSSARSIFYMNAISFSQSKAGIPTNDACFEECLWTIIKCRCLDLMRQTWDCDSFVLIEVSCFN